jgi:ATP-binding cassette subfamily A (ABC1) protein 3
MAPLILKQLLILLWKSWIMRKRHWISTIFELIFPLVLSILVVGIHSNATKGANSISERTSDVTKGPIYYNITKTYQINDIFDNFQTTIYYAPKNSTTDEIMNYLRESQLHTSNNKYFGNKTLTIVPFENEAELEANLTTESAINRYFSVIGVVFDLNELNKNEPNNRHLKYTIRLNDQMNVDKLFPIKTDAKPLDIDYGMGGNQYQSKFMQIQVALNEAYLNFVSKPNGRKETKVSNISSHPIPYPKYLDSGTKFGKCLRKLEIRFVMILFHSKQRKLKFSRIDLSNYNFGLCCILSTNC